MSGVASASQSLGRSNSLLISWITNKGLSRTRCSGSIWPLQQRRALINASPKMATTTTASGATSLELATRFIRSCLSNDRKRPLVVAVQGPQGSGKSYLSQRLQESLRATTEASSSSSEGVGPSDTGNQSLNILAVSLDDFYYPFDKLQELASTGNPLWGSRGLPGTHDVSLAVNCLKGMKQRRSVDVPQFDKSLNEGRGDRVEERSFKASPSLDVVIFEGWMVGFRSLSDSQLEQRYHAHDVEEGSGSDRESRGSSFFRRHQLSHLRQVNSALKSYEEIWNTFDVFVQIVPKDKNYTWEWRQEQETNMKVKNGGIGMTDEQVKKFVDRYQPAYELFLDGVHDDPNVAWKGKGLKILIDKERNVLMTKRF